MPVSGERVVVRRVAQGRATSDPTARSAAPVTATRIIEGRPEGDVVEVMVVGRQAEQRWRLASALDQSAGAAVPPDLAASRLSHPSAEPPDAVLLLVDGEGDIAWLHGHTSRSVRRWVPVVALVPSPGLGRAARAAGAAGVVSLEADVGVLAGQLRGALAEVTAPAVVIRLDAVRTA